MEGSMRFPKKLQKRNCTSRLGWNIAAACVLMAMAATNGVAESGPVVGTEDGVFRGVTTPTMNEFLGIRYAQAPVGDLRWRPPQPAARGAGIQDASQFGNHCPQPPSPFGVATLTEDCLFLNVFTPVRGQGGPSGHLPVMVWFHGGALVVGESDDYNPERLVEQGVIVVTVNYRLGALGFLAHPALSAEAGGASGNYGIMDQQLALEWVKRNIAGFGGDPHNVTIFGESAGG